MTAKPKVVLASYPRSGNTFVRNILLEVFSVFSWDSIDQFQKMLDRKETLESRAAQMDLPHEKLAKLDALRFQTTFAYVKTHDLPDNFLPLCNHDAKCIYLVRDGRDALVSIAHHRQDIIAPGSDFLGNLREAIVAAEGSYFGGWSANVRAWKERADVIIRFEELVKDPLGTIEPVRKLLGLPEPDPSKLPTFMSQRNGSSFFGGQERKRYSEEERKAFSKKFFRKGESGGWKAEMPVKLQKLFWKLHGETALEMGYEADGSLSTVKFH